MNNKKNKRKKILKNDLELKKIKQQAEEFKTGWQRTQADFANYQKRTREEKTQFIQNANKDLILQILPVLDNFSRAIKNQPQMLKSHKLYKYINGLEQIKNQLETILTNQKLGKIDTKPGDEFDPEIHEAIMTEESNEFNPDQIIEIIEDGYKLNNEIIRPVKVKVVK